MSTIVAAIRSPIVSVHPLQRAGTERRSAATPSPAHGGRRPGRRRPARHRPPAVRPWRPRLRCGSPATLTASAATPSSNSDHTGIRGSPTTTAAPCCRAGSALGTSTAIATVMITSDAESPTPDTELGEQATHGRADEHADAPHRRHQRRRPGPQPVRQRGIDHRVAQPGKHARRPRPARCGRPTEAPWSVRARTPGCPRRTRSDASRYDDPRPEPHQKRIDRGRRDHRADQVHRRSPTRRTADRRCRRRRWAAG